MTDPINPGTSPDSTPSPAGAWPPPADPVSSPDPAPPAFEAAEPGTVAPAEAVQREQAAPGGGPRRSNVVRWAIALVGVAVVLGVTAAVFALTAGRPNVSAAVGYMPDNVVQYAEYRLDLPGDQRQKLAEFLSVFPGFKDQSTFDSKLDETFDKIVAAVSSNQQTYTADIKPWFGGIVAVGSAPPAAGESGSMSMMAVSGEPLIVVTIKDKTKAADWIAGLHDAQLTRSEYNGAILFTATARDMGPTFAIAINDEVILAGTDAAVKKAVDSKGGGKLADDDQFKAAFGQVTDDYVGFMFMDYQASVQSYLDLLKSRAPEVLNSTAVDDELASLVPPWLGSVTRFESDALVTSAAFPSVDIGAASNKKSTLLGWAPPSTIAYTEVHDVGAALNALLERFRKLPEVSKALQQFDSTTGIGIDGIFGWWGDAAGVVAEDGSGHLGGGLVIIPTDAAKAKAAADTLRGLLSLGGGQAGIKVTDVQHGDATITIVDFSALMGADAKMLPAGYKPELAFTLTDQVVVVGYGQSFVESVLDAGPGPSLADDARVQSLVKRVGEENVGFTFVDVRRMRELFEKVAQGKATADKWSQYVKEYQPFLLPFDAMAASVRKDGDLNRGSGVVTVSQP
jgi:uncharacterized protein DUF3352